VLSATGADENLSAVFSRHYTRTKYDLMEFGEELGTPPVAMAILGGFGAYGHATGDPRGIRVFEAGVLSGALSSAAVLALERATGRARPNAGRGSMSFSPFSDDASFPSGHTALAFSLAATINYHFPGWIGRTMYLLACTTAYARVYQENHWLSDVVAGSILGGATGTLVARLNSAAAHGDLHLVPVVSPERTGLALQRRF
jgi:membrane-associated phospholipid phosphatase